MSSIPKKDFSNCSRPYQEESTSFLYEHDAALLLLRMGGGKTVITLTAIQELIRDRVIDQALVVAPKAVALNTWEQEAGQWEHTADLDVRVALGSPAQREAVVESRPQVLVITYDNLQWFAKRYGRSTYPLIVMDEVTRFKNAMGKRYRAFRPQLARARIRWGLTGSLGADKVGDIFNPVRAVDGGAALGRTLERFRGQYMLKDTWGWVPQPGAPERIARQIKHLCYQPDEAVYQSQLPAINYIKHDVPMDTVAYRKLQNEFCLEEITVASAGVMVNKLQQVGSGFLYPDLYLNSYRIDLVQELIEQAAGEPVLIWYWFEHTAGQLRALGAVDLVEHLDDWNAGKVPVAFCHPRSGGHGVNAQAGGSRMIWMEHTWSAEERAQAIARLHRQGQQRPVFVHDLVGGIDQEILNRQETKEGVADMVARILKSPGVSPGSQPTHH